MPDALNPRQLLTAAIAAAKAKGVYPAEIRIPVNPVGFMYAFMSLQGSVNSQLTCGAEPETLFLSGGNTQIVLNEETGKIEEEAEVLFSLNERSWNEFLAPSMFFKPLWKRILDATGSPPYASADFDLILGPEPEVKEETWHDRPSLL